MDDVAATDRSRPLQPVVFVRLWRALVDLMRIRRERSRARCQLEAMTERELQDCGMTWSEIAYKLRKPRRGK
ncbi:DUF1127 domain-containing protein [Bradyrhizobium huanghuaihaiense]|uniref:DUF1127 domain-containing protein n=1 Tax=Bradyrhizobium huanghuaihaiense TaxID=990078 RepID=UPI0021AA8EC1|nr:DUF1127 domain-containing protein [Bradyrhizobium sp. CB3035]UWU75020.1 DUF1127 domain-containing protein [Bradyrhizobium sp. CB3035]